MPRIRHIEPQEGYRLRVEFHEGYRVLYDVAEDIATLPTFAPLRDVYSLFRQAQLDTSRTCVYWNDQISLPSDAIYEYGHAV